MAAAKADASDPIAAEAAQETLKGGGRAADAAIAGFLAAAGARDAVMLAPTVALIGGLGAGARVIDGRAVQPGAGAKRPRGFEQGEVIPEAARAAVPRSLDALALLQIYGGRKTLVALARAGVARAREAGADRRRTLIEAFGRRGALVLRSGDPLRQLLRAASPPAGGIFTETDFTSLRPGDDEARFSARDGQLEIAATGFAPASLPPKARTQVIVAADGHGGVVALAYTPDDEGLAVPELELRLPLVAEPVRRSVRRLSPATPLAAPTPIALLRRSGEAWFAAAGVAGAQALDLEALDGDTPFRAQLTAMAGASRPALAASSQRRATTLVRVD